MSIKEENVYKYEKKTQKADSFDDYRSMLSAFFYIN